MGFYRSCGLLVAGIAVLVCWCVSAAANFAHARHLAGSSEWVNLLAAASASADVLKALSVIAFLGAIKRRYWFAALASVVIWVGCTGWAVRSALGFVAITFADSSTVRDNIATNEASVRDQIKAETARLKWLNAEIKTATGRDISKFSTEIDRSGARLEKLRDKAEHATGVSSRDPTADFLKANLAIPEAWTEMGTILGFLVLIELVSNFGPAMLRGFTGTASPVTTKLVAANDPAPARVQIEAAPEPPVLAPEPTKSNQVSHVRRFISTIPAGDLEYQQLYQSYLRHCAKADEPSMPPWQLGRYLVAAGLRKRRGTGGTTLYTKAQLAA